jgi:hypothetical protein
MRRILIIALAIGLGACGSMRAHFAFLLPGHHAAKTTAVAVVAPPSPPPTPAEGLWAILDPGCPKPSATNIHAWPKCASPFWISRGKALVVRTLLGKHTPAAATDASFAADYSLAPGDPVIAQVGTEKDGYLFLALTDLSEDGQGRLIGATGAAVSCPKLDGGGISLKPSANGCDTQSLADVRRAAVETLQDRAALTEVAWIAPGAP